LCPCGLTKYYSGDEIRNNEMNGACEMDVWRQEMCRVLVGRAEGRRLLGNLGAGGKIILKWILKT
jgi:hypothetical protein